MGAKFDSLFETLDKLAALPEGSDMYITRACADLAKAELEKIRAAGEPAPKLLPEEKDQISLTWDIRGVKIYRCLEVGDEPYTQVIER